MGRTEIDKEHLMYGEQPKKSARRLCIANTRYCRLIFGRTKKYVCGSPVACLAYAIQTLSSLS